MAEKTTKQIFFIILLLFVGVLTFFVYKVTNSNSESKVLSRRKRFLTFPDGSSFQLVFCTGNSGYLQIGNVVWFGNTAALAWELPTDPIFYRMLKHNDKTFEASRREDSRHVIFVDEAGKIISKVPYKRKLIVNPAFAKRSVDKKIVNVQKMHEMQAKKNHFEDLDESRIQFHREGRMSFYDQLIKFFESLGWSGKECVQRLLCESSKENHQQGAFLDEIFKATFTMPRTSTSSLHKDYDIENDNGDCKDRFLECHHNIHINNLNE